METQNLKLAHEWFKLHNIPANLVNGTIYYNQGAFEFELSESEIIYRANRYKSLKKHNLIKKFKNHA
jgi:hypothetical protein